MVEILGFVVFTLLGRLWEVDGIKCYVCNTMIGTFQQNRCPGMGLMDFPTMGKCRLLALSDGTIINQSPISDVLCSAKSVKTTQLKIAQTYRDGPVFVACCNWNGCNSDAVKATLSRDDFEASLLLAAAADSLGDGPTIESNNFQFQTVGRPGSTESSTLPTTATTTTTTTTQAETTAKSPPGTEIIVQPQGQDHSKVQHPPTRPQGSEGIEALQKGSDFANGLYDPVKVFHSIRESQAQKMKIKLTPDQIETIKKSSTGGHGLPSSSGPRRHPAHNNTYLVKTDTAPIQWTKLRPVGTNPKNVPPPGSTRLKVQPQSDPSTVASLLPQLEPAATSENALKVLGNTQFDHSDGSNGGENDKVAQPQINENDLLLMVHVFEEEEDLALARPISFDQSRGTDPLINMAASHQGSESSPHWQAQAQGSFTSPSDDPSTFQVDPTPTAIKPSINRPPDSIPGKVQFPQTRASTSQSRKFEQKLEPTTLTPLLHFKNKNPFEETEKRNRPISSSPFDSPEPPYEPDKENRKSHRPLTMAHLEQGRKPSENGCSGRDSSIFVVIVLIELYHLLAYLHYT